MSRIINALRAITKVIRNPWLLNKLMEDDKLWENYIRRHYQLSHGLPVLSILDLLPDFECQLNTASFLDGGSLPTDLALISCLAKRIPHCKYFEIGTWRGESAVNVSPWASEVYTLNLSGDEMRRKGFKEEYIQLHGYFSKPDPKIIHLEEDSFTFDFASTGKKFDLVYIDGDHHYAAVKNDTQKVLEQLVHDDTIIVWNDYAWNPEKVRFEVMAGILDAMPRELHRYIYHVSNTISAVFIKKDFPAKELASPSKPEIIFEVGLKAREL